MHDVTIINDDFLARVFLKYNSKMTGPGSDRCGLKCLGRIVVGKVGHVFGVKTSFSNFSGAV